MKKIFLLIVGIAAVLLCLSGCGVSKIPDENALKEMLSTRHPEFLQRYIYQEELFDIYNLEILRRQTNQEEKNDKVDCRIFVYNERYEGIFYYTLYLNYYDEGGWQLDNYEHFDQDEIKAKINTIPSEVIENEVTYYTGLYGALTFLEDSYNSETGVVTRKYIADNKFQFLTVSGDLTIEYSLCEEEFKDGSSRYWWKPIYLDNISLIWNLNNFYKLDDKNEDWYTINYPQIYGCEWEGANYRSKIESINITNLTDNKIELELLINVSYSDTKYSRNYLKEIEFEGKSKYFSKKVLSNREGDYIELFFDADKGIYIKYYNFEANKLLEYEFFAY